MGWAAEWLEDECDRANGRGFDLLVQRHCPTALSVAIKRVTGKWPLAFRSGEAVER